MRWSKGKNHFYAQRLYENLNSIEADEHSIIRIIVSNIDNMDPIKKEFIQRHKMSLEEAIIVSHELILQQKFLLCFSSKLLCVL